MNREEEIPFQSRELHFLRTTPSAGKEKETVREKHEDNPYILQGEALQKTWISLKPKR